MPLHVQIDTYDDPRDNPGTPVYHRGYCQIKVRTVAKKTDKIKMQILFNKNFSDLSQTFASFL